MTKVYQSILLSGLSLLILLTSFSQASALSCTSPSASWNIARPGDFSCRPVSCSDTGKYTCIKGASCGSGVCAALADCSSAFPGYSCRNNPSDRYAREKFHCPGDSSLVCSKLKSAANSNNASTPAEQGSECGANQKVLSSGGIGTWTNRVNMANVSGLVTIGWDFYPNPDRLIVRDSKGRVLTQSGSAPTSNKGSTSFNFTPDSNPANNYVTVTVYATGLGTTWEYAITCPGEALGPAIENPPHPDPEQAVEEPIIAPESAGLTKAPTVSANPLAGCCREIVPKDGNSYSEGAYGLNHFIQVGINIYECILCMVAALMLLMFVIGSFYLMTSAGSKPSVDKGIAIIKNAIIGAIIVFSSILIVNYSVKALGGSFLDAQKLQIDASVGARVASVPNVPVPVVVIPPPSTPIAVSVDGDFTFENCSQDQQDSIVSALKFTIGKKIASLGGSEDVYTYIKLYGFTTFICVGPRNNASAYYQSIGSGIDRVCPKLVNITPLFFGDNDMMRSSILLHEAVHSSDCISGNLDKGHCVAEQRAYSMQADYLELLGDSVAAKDFRCNWWNGYTSKGCSATSVTDVKCKS